MKKRKGLLLLDALLGLLVLLSLAVALYPLLGQAAYLADWANKRGRMVGESLYVMDEITEHLRNDLNTSPVRDHEVYQQDRYSYDVEVYVEKDKKVEPLSYTLYIEKEKLYLNVHGATAAPLTGETSDKVEAFAFHAPQDKTLFQKEGIGPVHVSFYFSHQMSGERLACETSILPYSDYYKKGQASQVTQGS